MCEDCGDYDDEGGYRGEDDEDEYDDSHSGRGVEGLAKKLGLHPRMKLQQDCADFYVLESLVAQKNTAAYQPFHDHVTRLCKEFSVYLDAISGGELRHSGGVGEPKLPLFTEWLNTWYEEYKKKGKNFGGGRTGSWDAWLMARKEKGPELLREGIVAFRKWPWSGGFGGEKWATIAEICYDYLYKNLKPRTFVDRVWTLQHNGGTLFDKMYHEYNSVMKVLELQAGDHNYDKLASLYSSPAIKRLYQAEKYAGYTEFDSVWLGRSYTNDGHLL